MNIREFVTIPPSRNRSTMVGAGGGLVKLCVVLLVQATCCASRPPTPALTDTPHFLDSFIPAGMQIVAYLTELMKYDLRPTTTTPAPPGATPTRPTLRPTPPHRPAVYAPQRPPGPQAFYNNQRNGSSYFSRYPQAEGSARNLDAIEDNVPLDFYLYFGRSYTDLLRLANRLEPVAEPNDVDVQVNEFSKEFDDDPTIRSYLVRQKQVPPTRAYVTLLSLYDMLNKESKRQGLNKFQGYTDNVLKDLIDSSISTSAYQLRTVLNKIVQRQDTNDPNIVKKIKQIVNDIDEHDSYMNLALRYIPPLNFVA